MTSDNRLFFDYCDRLALRRLLPKQGEKIIDVCGGFGRLAGEYLDKYKEACLFDYAPNLLSAAKKTYGNRLQTVQGSVYEMPFKSGEFDTLIMVRAAHLLTDLNMAVKESSRILKNHGSAVIEIANKRNIFEIARRLCGRSALHPFSLETESRHKIGFFCYHPRHIEQIFRQNGLLIKKVLSVSGLRRHVSKSFWGIPLLCALEYLLQYTVGRIKWGASLFYLLEKSEHV